MGFPAGVATRQVTIGPFLTQDGNPSTGYATFTSNASLVWDADGSVLLSAPIVVPLDASGLVTVTLADTDQGGFSDGRGNAIIDWTWIVGFAFGDNTAPVPAIYFHLIASGSPYHLTPDLGSLLPTVRNIQSFLIPFPILEHNQTAANLPVGYIGPWFRKTT
jgi:hypothetical protein